MIGVRKFRTQKARTRERAYLSLRITALLIGVCVVSLGVVYGLNHPALRMQHVVAHSDGNITDEVLRDEVQVWLSGTTLNVIPHDSIVFFSKKRLAAHLHAVLPRINALEVTRHAPRTLVVDVKERTPAALWCGDIVPPVAQTRTASSTSGWGTCYLLDVDSFVYARAPRYSGTPFPRYYASLAQAEPVGQYMIDPDEFANWQRFYQGLDDQGTPLHALLFVDERDVELYLVNGIRILAPRDATNIALSARVHVTLESGSLDMTRSVQYVDMRFGNKVFIKYNEEL